MPVTRPEEIGGEEGGIMRDIDSRSRPHPAGWQMGQGGWQPPFELSERRRSLHGRDPAFLRWFPLFLALTCAVGVLAVLAVLRLTSIW